MSVWAIVLPLVLFPVMFWLIFTLVMKIATTGIAATYPAVEPEAEPGSEPDWRPCQRVVVGNARLSGGMVEAALDVFGLHVRPSGFAQAFGGKAFSLPWSVLEGHLHLRVVKGVPVLETRLPHGQRFAADVWCFAVVADVPEGLGR